MLKIKVISSSCVISVLNLIDFIPFEFNYIKRHVFFFD